MATDSQLLIDIALRKGIVTPQQAAMLREELDMFPGQKIGNVMLKRQYITPEQLMELNALVAHQSISSMSSVKNPALGGTARRSGESVSRVGRSAGPTGISRLTMAREIPVERKIFDYIRFAVDKGCSDLHLSVGRPPYVRLNGELHYLKDTVLTAEGCRDLNFELLDEAQQEVILQNRQLDFALTVPGASRVRGNICHQRGGWEGAYRILPNKIRSIEQLGLPPVLKSLTDYNEGLVLVTGAAGQGKNTTVAAMLDHINQTREDHIITVEDPIEYIFEPAKCAITQREIGPHSQSFAAALRSALRQDPDVIFVGEMRDLETISIAITAAETGHLVFGTLHTNSASRTIARIMNAYPPGQRGQVCTIVADCLRGIVSQQLIPRKDKKGIALAQEILTFNAGIAQAIKDGKTHQLTSLMQAGKKYGMKTMDESLKELVDKGAISGRDAYLRTENKSAFESMRNN
ncbi:MAG: PilT/PilU family type 4a pilus ATPase [Candidatus Sumerlaeaceae bacterium]|nr:PilT/PilU family type 4a pilus ATPase [Candidatus Sumerlaeaceae bacterium]